MRFLLGIFAGTWLCLSTVAWSQEDGFVPLFDGHSLNGWIQRGGEAQYVIEDGAIVGTSVPHTPNSFLCTQREFADFVLELEFQVDPRLNSGIQIRSHISDEPLVVEFVAREGQPRSVTIPPHRVYGYQVEIDPSDRAYSGAIYDESRRGWLYDFAGEQHQAARQAFRAGHWNHFRILAKGNAIQTWVNGIEAANLTDEMDESGFIGLQVHSVDHDEKLQVRWRNIRIKEL